MSGEKTESGVEMFTNLKRDVWDKPFYSKILFYQNQTLYLKNSIIKTH